MSHRWQVLAVVSGALLIVVVDVTVLHIAAAEISADLHPSALELLWIIDIYPLVAAPLLIVTATLGDRLGRKRILIAGLLVFAFASLLAAFAPTPGALIGARALQGVGGAMIMPSTMSIVRAVFPDREERVRAVSIWSAVLAGGAAIGPFVGGLLVEHFSWHAVFLINIPVTAVLLPFALRIVPESRSGDPPPWDPAAVVFAAGGVLLFTLGVKEGARHGFATPLALGALSLGVALIWAFCRRQLARRHPLLDLRLFADRAFSASVGIVALTIFALVGLELFFALYLQLVLGLGPLDASIRLLPLMGATLLGALAAPAVLRRLGTRRTLIVSLGVAAVSMLPLLALGVEDRYLLLLPTFIFLGSMVEIALVAANDTIISAVSADDAGQATAIEETAYELGGGIGVAVLGSIGAAVYTAGMATVSGVGSRQMADADESLAEAVGVAAVLPPGPATRLMDVARESFVDGMQVAVLIATVLIGISALVVAVALRER